MRSIIAFSLLFVVNTIIGQHQHDHYYKWEWKKDGLILGAHSVFWGASLYMKSQTDKITLQDLEMLDPANLPGFDRSATDNYSESANKISDVFLFGSTVLPFLPHISDKVREEDFAIVGMALETFFLTDGFTNVIKSLRKRFRPFTYNDQLSDEIRLSRGARYSFPSGHTSTTAALSFFAAKVYSDLHPNSKWKPLIWSFAITLPAANGYLRYRAGKHFPTDVIAGYVLGAGIGLLVPSLHKLEHDEGEISLNTTGSGVLLSVTF